VIQKIFDVVNSQAKQMIALKEEMRLESDKNAERAEELRQHVEDTRIALQDSFEESITRTNEELTELKEQTEDQFDTINTQVIPEITGRIEASETKLEAHDSTLEELHEAIDERATIDDLDAAKQELEGMCSDLETKHDELTAVVDSCARQDYVDSSIEKLAEALEATKKRFRL
jgi:hypothetical protein